MTVERLLWVIESFATWREQPFHEVAFSYVMDLPADTPYRDIGTEFTGHEGPPPLRFRWFPLTTLDRITLCPSFLFSALANLPDTPRHIVHWDE